MEATDQNTVASCAVNMATSEIAASGPATVVNATFSFPANAATNRFTNTNMLYYLGQYSAYVLTPPSATPPLWIKPTSTDITLLTGLSYERILTVFFVVTGATATAAVEAKTPRTNMPLREPLSWGRLLHYSSTTFDP
ncbi:hypothetical protein Ciccas_011139 [Cichlidogyrus casuarinus]|uniref:Uncharacterized protein n=1 Tax=Cichlidogyrus casuarinus TaxID=1844966 RepID=A0ABD2PS38_9PLAT